MSNDEAFLSRFQIAALTYSYKRLIKVWGTGPLVVILVPYAITFVVGAFDIITDGCGMVALTLSCGFGVFLYWLVYQRLNFDGGDPNKALLPVTVGLRLPLIAIVGGWAVTRYMLCPLLWKVGLMTTLLSPGISLLVPCFHCAVTMALLGLAVISRYWSVGPPSIMRCSCVPLATNPFDATLQYLRVHPASIVEPSDHPGQLLTSPFLRPFRGRRYQHPSRKAILVHILIATGIGIAVAFSAIIRYFTTFGAIARSIVVTSTVLTLLVALVVSALGVWSHELDPKRHFVSIRDIFCSKVVRSVTLTSAAVPVLARSLVSWISFGTEELPQVHVSGFIVRLVIWCAVMGMYLAVLDEMIRVVLFYPRVDLKRLAEELQSDETSLLDVVMHGLLYDASLVKEVCALSLTTPNADLFQQEMRQCELCSKTLANMMMSLTVQRPEAPLEEDVFRVAILEYFCRSDTKVTTNETPDEFSVFHSKNHKMFTILIVRTMCVFVAALGESLRLCINPAQERSPVKDGATMNTLQSRMMENWKLSAGFFVCAADAARAVSLFIVESMVSDTVSLIDWRSNPLSFLVPAALKSIFVLRDGAYLFGNGRHVRHTSAVNPGVGVDPRIVALIRVCDDAGAQIVKSLHSPQAVGGVDLGLDEDCRLWVMRFSQRVLQVPALIQ